MDKKFESVPQLSKINSIDPSQNKAKYVKSKFVKNKFKQQVSGILKGTGKGGAIIYTGKQKPYEVIKQLEMAARLRNPRPALNLVQVKAELGESGSIESLEKIPDQIGEGLYDDSHEPREESCFQSPKNLIHVTEQITEPKKDSAEDVADAAKDSILEQIRQTEGKQTSQFDIVSEERKAEDSRKVSLKKIVDKEKLKFRLQSSKNRQKTSTKAALMSPPSGVEGFDRKSSSTAVAPPELKKNKNQNKAGDDSCKSSSQISNYILRLQGQNIADAMSLKVSQENSELLTSQQSIISPTSAEGKS